MTSVALYLRVQTSLAASIHPRLPHTPQHAALVLGNPPGVLWIRLAFVFHLCHPTFLCIFKTKEMLSGLTACAWAILCLGNIPPSSVAKSSLSFWTRVKLHLPCETHVLATGPASTPLSCAPPVSHRAFFKPWCHHFAWVWLMHAQNHRLEVRSQSFSFVLFSNNARSKNGFNSLLQI